MNAASVYRSERLRRVRDVLADHREHSTRDIVLEADVCAVNSCVSELRAQGYVIHCRRAVVDGARRWLYRLEAPAQPSLWDAA